MKNLILCRVAIINISAVINLFLSGGDSRQNSAVLVDVHIINMMKMQHQAHTAVQENNYDLSLHAL